MSSSTLTVHLNDFINNVCDNYKDLLTDPEFADVTLASEDGKEIKAHRVILASSSLFFREIFRKNPNINTLVYLKGVGFKELSDALSFIYLGKIEIVQAQMIKFMEIASFLKIRGLVQNEDQDIEKQLESLNEGIKNRDANALNTNNEEIDLDNLNLIESASSDFSINEEDEKNTAIDILRGINSPAIKFLVTSDDREKPQGSDMFLIRRKPVYVSGKRRNIYSCSKCEYEGMNLSNVKIHIQKEHTDIKIQCPIPSCEKKYNEPSSLKHHIFSVHEGIRHPCTFCEYKSTSRSGLKYHIFNFHKEM